MKIKFEETPSVSMRSVFVSFRSFVIVVVGNEYPIPIACSYSEIDLLNVRGVHW